MVTEKDGHSWVEVYFDGVGWVEFEPTAGLPALARPGATTWPRPQCRPCRPARFAGGCRIPWGLVALGAVLLLAASLVIWIWRPAATESDAGDIRQRPAPGWSATATAGLLRWGRRLNQPFRDGQTPREYGADPGPRPPRPRRSLPLVPRPRRRAPPPGPRSTN